MGGGEDAGAGVSAWPRRSCRGPLAFAALLSGLCASLSTTLSAAPIAPRTKPLEAAVAANFRATFAVVAEAAAADGHAVNGTFGASGLLYAQIVNGRPFDVFLSADAERPAALLAAGLAFAPVVYATGRLVLLVNDGAPGPGWLAEDKRVALADPALAPYGRAAAQTLAGLGAEVQRIVATNVAQAFQFADSGAIDGAFVALAQVRAEGRPAARYWIVPERRHEAIEQVAVGIRGGDEARARAFLEFLAAPETQALLRARGYR